MWFFITARIRQWILFAIAIPLLTVLVRYIRMALVRRSGETRLTRGLGKLENLGRSRRRGFRRG